MNSPAIKTLLKTLLTLFIVCLVFFIPWYYFFAPKNVSQHWQEEISLSNGSVIWITRTAKFELNNIGPLSKFIDAASRGTMTNMVLTIEIPKNSIANSPPKWSFNAVPILLDYDVEKETWIIIATYFYCGSWVEAGRPSLATWQYIVSNNQWVVVPLDLSYVGRVSNLSRLFTDYKKELKTVTKKEIVLSNKGLDNLYRSVNGIEKPGSGCVF